MSSKITREQMATDYNAWTEYVDPQGVVTEKQFRRTSTAKKLQIIEKVFGKEVQG